MMALDIDDPRWSEFVEASTDTTPFHHPSWARLIARCYGFQVFALAAMDRTEQIVAGLPMIEVGGALRRRRWVSLPFTDRCPVLAQCETERVTFIEALVAARRQAHVARLEVRDDLAVPGARQERVAVVHCLHLGRDYNKVYSGFKRPVRKGIARAEDIGVTVRWGESRLALTDEFYRLHVKTRQRLGVPVQPRRYFDLLWQDMIGPGRGFVLLAYEDRTLIAGAVFLAWRGTINYKYGASNPQ
jgi:hypothetical protein